MLLIELVALAAVPVHARPVVGGALAGGALAAVAGGAALIHTRRSAARHHASHPAA
ncbi:hypothetical protein ACIRYZ_41040 [Kitasatospora sp. NPDC101155]|uniref:hypothetical protein n=1 Tax=Kitasatospora sp. NPDC101155 TaxID=3364097 RepID=UPI0037F8FC46